MEKFKVNLAGAHEFDIVVKHDRDLHSKEFEMFRSDDDIWGAFKGQSLGFKIIKFKEDIQIKGESVLLSHSEFNNLRILMNFASGETDEVKTEKYEG